MSYDKNGWSESPWTTHMSVSGLLSASKSFHLQYQCEDLLSTQNRRPVVEDIFLDKNRQIPQQEAWLEIACFKACKES